MIYRVIALLITFILILSGVTSAQEIDKEMGHEDDNKTLEERVDQIFAQWDRPGSPGCALAVIRNGKIVYKRGYGMARLDSDVPITPATVFDIGSMSKQFTAACIVLLAEDGNISLDDDIRKHFPEFPDYGTPITIRHLIHNTSGIRDYPWLMLLARMSSGDTDKDKKQEILNLISRQRGLQFSPGDEYYYSNSNYFLLGAIVERVTKVTIGEYAAKHIFGPLGMQNTFVYEKQMELPEKSAHGHVQDARGGYGVKSRGIMSGAGGVNSTVEDLIRWSQNFYENRIGGPGFNTTMVTPGKLNNGDTIKYAFGLEIGKYRGLKTIGHKGFTESFDTYMVRFPDQDFTVICLANLGTIHSDRLSMKVADLYLADQLEPVETRESKPEPVKRTEISLDPSILDAYVGAYRFDFGLLMNITKEDDSLMMKAGQQPKLQLFPESEIKFFLKVADVQVSFNKGGSGKVTCLTLHQAGRAMQANRVEAVKAMPSEKLAEFTGDYFSDELQVTYTVAMDEDQLFVRATRLDEPLRYVQGDGFAYSKGDIVFQRDDKGMVISFILEVKTERLSFKFAKNK